MPNDSRTNRLQPYILITAVALFIRLAVIPFVYTDWLDPFVLDHWAFGLIARSIVSGHGFGNVFAPNTGPTAVLPPVYSYLLAGIFRLFGIETKAAVLAALSLNSVFSALTCIPVFVLSRRAFGDRVAKWAGWGWALSPYGIYYGADWAWSTCLVTLELVWLFYWAWRLEESSRTRDWLLFGLVGGFSALTEPVVLAVVPLFALWTIYRRARQGQPWTTLLLAGAIGAIAIMSPWLMRDYEVFHRFIPVRSGYGLELYIGNNGYSTRWVNSSLHLNHNDAELNEYERIGEMAYMDHKKQQAQVYIRAHPAWFLWMTCRRALYMWTGYWSFSHEYLKDEPLDPPNIFVATTMTILALIGLRSVFRLNRSMGVRFAILLIFFPLAYYFSHPETYYLRPLDPLITVLAAVTVAGAPKKKVVSQVTVSNVVN
ncbi:MAG TPA: glycosyltransferase family 39 protein [Candidatus Eisenbacteria bacterium]|nr:glycosyltransferase family 39 protein [Candidatus Eisenbacteria bacterium]